MVHRVVPGLRNFRNDLFINVESYDMICTEYKLAVVQFLSTVRCLEVGVREKPLWSDPFQK